MNPIEITEHAPVSGAVARRGSSRVVAPAA